jgi:hypothetical protein
MTCDPDPYGFGEPYCINTNGGDIPDTLNGTAECDDLTTKGIINGDAGVEGERLCPQPYRCPFFDCGE